MTDRPQIKRISRLAFATGAAFATIGIVRAEAQPARFVWKCGNDFGADHPVNVRNVEAFGKIRAESRGQLDITSYPNSALGGTNAMVSQLRLGAIEMMSVGGGALEPIVPLSAIETVAFVLKDRATAYAAMDGELGNMIRATFPAKGFISLEKVYETGWRDMTTSTKPIRNVADLQGFKMRVGPGKLYFDTFKSLGASPTPLVPAEIYPALQTHLIDGQETPLGLMASLKQFEVQKYASLTHHMWTPIWFIVNKDKWESLPHDLQEIARKHINAGAMLERRDLALQDASLRDRLSRQGMIFNDPDRAGMRAKLVSTGYYERWREDYGPTAWAMLEKFTGPLH